MNIYRDEMEDIWRVEENTRKKRKTIKYKTLLEMVRQ